jgi:hypothetical protein
MAPVDGGAYPPLMSSKVYIPLVGGLGIASVGVAQLSDGMGWLGVFEIACGVAAIALALVYWRGSRAKRS